MQGRPFQKYIRHMQVILGCCYMFVYRRKWEIYRDPICLLDKKKYRRIDSNSDNLRKKDKNYWVGNHFWVAWKGGRGREVTCRLKDLEVQSFIIHVNVHIIFICIQSTVLKFNSVASRSHTDKDFHWKPYTFTVQTINVSSYFKKSLRGHIAHLSHVGQY
jgi:hypothetical protein